MTDILLVPVAVTYLGVVLALFVFGVNFSYLTWAAFREQRTRPRTETPPVLPMVTVQLPIFNERYVAESVVDAAARIRYPRDRFQIQVLDDSTDDTTDILARCIEKWRGCGVRIEHIRRASRIGYKAGALSQGLQRALGEYIAVFDADFTPSPDFLERTVPVLHADRSLAFAQARWGHTNRNQSLLTRAQAMSIDGHFGIEQQARWARGHCFNFNGTAGLWRRRAIIDAGGWSHRTLTEDLDLSYRAHLRGWSAAYLHDLEVQAELPVSMDAYRRQQHRWARGSLQCAAYLIPIVGRSDLRLRSKVQAVLHLSGYVIHLLLLSLVVLYPAAVLLSRNYPSLLSLLGMMAMLNLVALAPSALFLSAQHYVGRRWYAAIPVVALLTLVGVGMMVNTGRAALSVLGGRTAIFERTPKFGAEGARSDWRRLGYHGGVDVITIVELGAVLICVWTAWLAATTGTWAIAVYTLIFGAGFVLNVGLTFWHAIGVAIQRPSDLADVEFRALRSHD